MADPYAISAASAAWSAAFAGWASVAANAAVVGTAFLVQHFAHRHQAAIAKAAEDALRKDAADVALRAIEVMHSLQANHGRRGAVFTVDDATYRLRGSVGALQHMISRNPQPVELMIALVQFLGRNNEMLVHIGNGQMTEAHRTIAGRYMTEMAETQAQLEAWAGRAVDLNRHQ